MNCAEVQQHLPEMIDGSQDATYQAHLKSCSMCSDLVSDLQLIANEAHQLKETDDPPQRVWVKIAAELRAEGIIRDTEVAGRPVLVPASERRWNGWWMVPVAAALLAAGTYFIQPKPAVPVANQNPPAAVTKTENTPVVASNETPRAVKAVAAPQNQKPTVPLTHDEPASNAPLMTASTSDQRLLDAVSPDMRSAYETQLRAVNAYIQDAEAYVKRNPDDEDARQHLMGAYEQREMLYQMALDHVQ